MGKKVVKIILIVVCTLVVIFGAMAIGMTWGSNSITAAVINNVDIASVADGVYTGSFDGYRWSNTVDVTVASGKITKIDVKKTPMFNLPEVNNKIIGDVIKEQSLDIDVVSGSTVTSKSILKAIEIALSSK